MRDFKRIRKFCNMLAAAWEQHPDLRFGQLMTIVFERAKQDSKDPFYLEENEMMEYIQQFTEGA